MKDKAQISLLNVAELLETRKTDALVNTPDCEHMVLLIHHNAYIIGILVKSTSFTLCVVPDHSPSTSNTYLALIKDYKIKHRL